MVWGLLHGVYQVTGALLKPIKDLINERLRINKTVFSYHFGQRIITFLLVNLSWIFFRASGTRQALFMIRSMTHFNPWIIVDGSLLSMGLTGWDLNILVIAVIILILTSILQTRMHLREKIAQQNLWFRWTLYFLGIFAVVIFGIYGPGYEAAEFIYMQF